MVSKHIDEIRANPLFASTDDASFQALVRGAYVQNFPPLTELITEGESADFLHIVSSGCVELFSEWQGRETGMTFLCENATFILAATIKDRPYLMSARTIRKSRIIMIPSQDVRSVFDVDPAFAKAIVTELAGCYRASIKHTKGLKLRTSTERLANFLHSAFLENGKNAEFELAQEKRRIASFLNMTPENLSRAFASLKDHGVEVEGQVVRITAVDKLTAYARPNPLIDS